MDWLAGELPARRAEARVHQQSVNQIRAQFYAETVQYWYDKLQRLGDKRITRWITAAAPSGCVYERRDVRYVSGTDINRLGFYVRITPNNGHRG